MISFEIHADYAAGYAFDKKTQVLNRVYWDYSDFVM